MRHQVVFINPGTSGLFAAYLLHRAGVDCAIVEESSCRSTAPGTGFPEMFPAGGTYYPADIDNLFSDTGIPPLQWRRIPKLQLWVGDRELVLNSDDGPGGLLLEIGKAFHAEKNDLVPWFQDILSKTSDLINRETIVFRPVITSVEESIGEIGLQDPDQILHVLNAVSILVAGRGILQTDIKDFPKIIAGFLNGWHVPNLNDPNCQNLQDIFRNRLQDENVRWLEVELIDDIECLKNRESIIHCSGGVRLSGQILAAGWDDRFKDPAGRNTPDTILWESWHSQVPLDSDIPEIVGLVYHNGKRPPVNDNFISYHARAGTGSTISVSSPVEERYLNSDSPDRMKSIAGFIRSRFENNTGIPLMDIHRQESTRHDKLVTLPGASRFIYYSDRPVWGSDISTILMNADKLSGQIIESLNKAITK